MAATTPTELPVPVQASPAIAVTEPPLVAAPAPTATAMPNTSTPVRRAQSPVSSAAAPAKARSGAPPTALLAAAGLTALAAGAGLLLARRGRSGGDSGNANGKAAAKPAAARGAPSRSKAAAPSTSSARPSAGGSRPASARSTAGARSSRGGSAASAGAAAARSAAKPAAPAAAADTAVNGDATVAAAAACNEVAAVPVSAPRATVEPTPLPEPEPSAPATPAPAPSMTQAVTPDVTPPKPAAPQPQEQPPLAASAAAAAAAATATAAAVDEQQAKPPTAAPAEPEAEEATADANGVVEKAVAAPATAANGEEQPAAAENGEGGDVDGTAAAEGGEDDGLIELADGETLPVVDEEGNQVGTLHADGRVLDEAGTQIGALDDDGNVVLFEQQSGEDITLSPAEEQAEQLMRQAAVAWNVQQNRAAAEQLQRKALEVVTATPGAARPEVIAEVASSLADMAYATNKLTEAKEALQVALDAAQAGEQHALYIKLSNNMGAVLRKQELHSEGRELHEKAMAVAMEHFGVAHATTTLARGNLVDALDQLGERAAARALLLDNVAAIAKVLEQKEAEEASGVTDAAPNGGDAASSPEMEAMLAIDSKRATSASVRAQIELARLEMKDKDFPAAVTVLEAALAQAKRKFGEETPEASSVLAALATCHRQAGDFATSASLFESLYEINERQSEGGAANQSGVMLARTLADVLSEAERWSDAVRWAEKALALMQAMAGVRVHPALEPLFNLVIDLRTKSGDEAGAEELRRQLLKGRLQAAAAQGRPQAGGKAAGKAGGAGGAGGNGKRGGSKARK